MKKQLVTGLMMLAAMSVFAIASPLYAQGGQNGHGHGDFGSGAVGPGEFIDENGDGFNDLAPDADGDGIPNAYDEDYVPAGGGNGPGNGTGEFVDENGDGYNDNAPDEDGDGIPNAYDEDYVGPQDGTGFGGGNGSGNGQGGQGSGNGGHNGSGPGDGSGVGPGNGQCTPELAEPVQSRFQLNTQH